jgi:TonB-dependent receptor
VGGGLDWTQPIVRTDKAETDSKLKFGGLVSVRSRDFTSRTLRYSPTGNHPDILRCQSADLQACTDALYVPSNINASGGPLRFEEVTLPQDSYNADLNVYAGYLMADLGLHERFRLILGERVEHTYQTVEPYDQFGIARAPDGAKIKETDLLPAISFVWSTAEKTKLRGSLTRTLARPQLRELAPFIFQDFFGGRAQTGNPELDLTHIINADLRYEYFPTLREVLATSIFFKKFNDPIEPIVKLGADDGQVTYRNADGATLYGVELEARKNLEFMTPAMKDFSMVSNLTLATSSIEVGDEEGLALTNHTRPLVNQAPYVFNFALDYTNENLGTTARLLYNLVGPTIIEVGTKSSANTAGLDDAYLHPRHLLDLTFQQDITKQFEIKFSIKNLLNSPYKVTQGCGRETSNGQSKPKQGLFDTTWHLSCDASDDTITRRYTDGVSLSLSGSYTF